MFQASVWGWEVTGRSGSDLTVKSGQFVQLLMRLRHSSITVRQIKCSGLVSHHVSRVSVGLGSYWPQWFLYIYIYIYNRKEWVVFSTVDAFASFFHNSKASQMQRPRHHVSRVSMGLGSYWPQWFLYITVKSGLSVQLLMYFASLFHNSKANQMQRPRQSCFKGQYGVGKLLAAVDLVYNRKEWVFCSTVNVFASLFHNSKANQMQRPCHHVSSVSMGLGSYWPQWFLYITVKSGLSVELLMYLRHSS